RQTLHHLFPVAIEKHESRNDLYEQQRRYQNQQRTTKKRAGQQSFKKLHHASPDFSARKIYPLPRTVCRYTGAFESSPNFLRKRVTCTSMVRSPASSPHKSASASRLRISLARRPKALSKLASTSVRRVLTPLADNVFVIGSNIISPIFNTTS